MRHTRLGTATPLVCIFLIASITPTVFAVEYLPGVVVGQWVKYKANFSTDWNLPVDWMIMEVTDVSGKEVTIRSSLRYLNGTVPANSSMVCNIEEGLMNGTCSRLGLIKPIIASNLNEGDELNLPSCGNFKINKTETRTYLGIDRTVNIQNTSTYYYSIYKNITMEYSRKLVFIYDRVSGMMLEMFFMTNMTQPFTTYLEASIIVTDTNIFTAPTLTTTTTSRTTTQTTSSPTTTYTSTSTPTSTTTSSSTTTTSLTTTSSPTSTQQQNQAIPTEWIVILVIMVFGAIAAALLLSRRSKKNT